MVNMDLVLTGWGRKPPFMTKEFKGCGLLIEKI